VRIRQAIGLPSPVILSPISDALFHLANLASREELQDVNLGPSGEAQIAVDHSFSS